MKKVLTFILLQIVLLLMIFCSKKRELESSLQISSSQNPAASSLSSALSQSSAAISSSSQSSSSSAASISSAPSSSQASFVNGLIGYWPLDENSGTAAPDLAGGNQGTLYNSAYWTAGM
ncbi:MAG TPA: hypothetical protein VKS21_08380, partial [Spirochaetota bacterium]|nr:hypothetical protein [Spirochaetota bacterium]